jgi:hypothetical protein
MKRLLFFLGIIFISLSIFSQDFYRSYDHHDILIGYGQFIPDQFKSVNTTMLNDLYPDQRYVRDHYSSAGALFITYRHIFKNELFLWGITAGISNSKSEIYNVGQFVGELKRQFISIAIEWDYRYVNQGPIQVYSGFGVGFTFATETLTPPPEMSTNPSTANISNIAYQINAVGLRLGKKYAGFIELGYGYKGIINVGFSVQLF